jgi:hypothetical protein
MWLYTHRGFLSIVQDFTDENQLVVRGKFKEDIQAYFPHALVEIDPNIDYKYKTCLPKAEVAARLLRYVQSELNVRYTKRKDEEQKIS